MSASNLLNLKAPAAQAVAASPRFHANQPAPLIALVGDSRCFLSSAKTTATTTAFKSFAFGTHLQGYCGGTVRFQHNLNFGVAGENTDDLVKRVPSIITTMQAAGCTMAVLLSSTNDRPAGFPLRQTQENIRRILRLFEDAKILVFVISELPRGNGVVGSGTNTLTPEQTAIHFQVHNWMEDEIAKSHPVINAWKRWVDPASGTQYLPKPGLTTDNLHPNIIGSELIAGDAAPVVLLHARYTSRLLKNNWAYNASTAPKGNLIANAMMEGTTGSIASNANPKATAKQLASNFSAEGNNMAGLQTEWSKGAIGDLITQDIRVTGTVGSNVAELVMYQDVTLSQLTDGDSIFAICRSLTSGDGCTSAALAILAVSTSYFQTIDGDPQDHQSLWPSKQVDAVRWVPSYNFKAADTLIRVRYILTFKAGATVDFTARVAQLSAHKD